MPPLDVTREDAIEPALDAAVERFGPIDVLVNNAGIGFVGALEEMSLGDRSDQLARRPDGRPRYCLLDADEPPLRLALGADALEGIRGRYADLTSELADWEHLARSTDVDA